MLSLVFGKDYKNVRKEAEKIVASFSAKGNVAVEKHTAETISPKDLAYRAESNSLFGEKFAYIIDGLVDQYQDETLAVLDKLGQSQRRSRNGPSCVGYKDIGVNSKKSA